MTGPSLRRLSQNSPAAPERNLGLSLSFKGRLANSYLLPVRRHYTGRRAHRHRMRSDSACCPADRQTGVLDYTRDLFIHLFIDARCCVNERGEIWCKNASAV